MNVGTSAWRASGVDVEHHVEAILVPDLLQLHVAIDEGQFPLQRDHLILGVVEGEAQQVAELFEHPAGRARRALDVRRDGVERVEQEMRVELGAERVEARLGQQPFELRRPDRAVARLILVLGGDVPADDGPVDQPVEAVERRERRAGQQGGLDGNAQRAAGAVVDVGEGPADDDAERDVQEQPWVEDVAGEGQLPVGGDDHRHEQQPRDPAASAVRAEVLQSRASPRISAPVE